MTHVAYYVEWTIAYQVVGQTYRNGFIGETLYCNKGQEKLLDACIVFPME